MATTIEVETRSAREVVDITARVDALLGGARDGSRHLFLKHTTAGLMILTGEAGVPEDIMDILQTLVPRRAYRHDSPAHVAATSGVAWSGRASTSRCRVAGSPSASSSGSR